ncbi:hypothetical protein ACP70R_030281 [Stipagrostis hirtigluma subsp. patula]
MERIPAASAMDWSVELDRGLRSRHHVTRVHALEAAGPRLRQLCASSTAPAPVASAFGALPAEARLFAETMLLRLATEFRNADGALRARIVRTLLAATGSGGLAGARVAEPEQLLRRVKAVYDTGSVRDRALALRVFGCLAGIAKDSVHVRSLILSSLGASSAVEVKAALFAAGCVCHLSEDFSCIILVVLRGLICSRSSEPQVIMAAIKAFSKLDSVGKQMVLGALEDVFKAEMLSVLSRLASRSTILFSDQVELVLLFLGHDSSPSMKAVALKCLRFMCRRNTCHFPVVRTVFGILLPLIDDEDFPLECRSDILRILQKMLCGSAPTIHHFNGSEISDLVLAAESSLRSSSLEMQGTAIEILVEIFCILRQARPDLSIPALKDASFAYIEHQGISNNMSSTCEENGKDRLLYNMMTAIVDHSVSLVNQVNRNESKEVTSRNICMSSESNKDLKALFGLMLKVVTCYPSAAAVALDKLIFLLEELVQTNDSDHSDVALEELNASNGNVDSSTTHIKVPCNQTDIDEVELGSTEINGKKKEYLIRDLIHCTIKFANACHNILCIKSSARHNLHDIIKRLIKYLQQNASEYWSTYETFHLIMCACIACSTCKIRDGNQELGDSKEEPNIFVTPSVWIAQELCALRMAKMLIRKQKYWEAYRSSMYCCREGLWFTASFVFRKLADAFELGSFSFWFKSLLLFSAGEIEMKLLLFPSATIKLVAELKTDGDLSEDLYSAEADADSSLSGSELHGCQAKFTGICSRTFLANDALASSACSDREFRFQRWFISLRSSFVEVLTDVLGSLTAHSPLYEAGGDHVTISGELINNHILALVHCSLRLSDLAKSYDLLAATHMDMDRQSFTSIARLAFMCSLLAFCTAFSVDFSTVSSHVEPCKLPKRFSHASILQDLHGRVDGVDTESISQLRQFVSTSFDELDSFWSSTRMSCSGNLENDSYSLYQFTVASLLRIRGNTKETRNGEGCLSALHGGSQFLCSILQKFMALPFVVPKYFFRVRPCLGVELYMFNSSPAKGRKMSVEPGFQLSLTLCMQWKRVLDRASIRLMKLYCILSASSASCLDAAGTRSNQFDKHKTTEMVELNTKLLQYIKNDLRKGRDEKSCHTATDMVTAFACFEPAGSGQGFSSCLLNVSSFPEGSYQIKWHACCVDENGSYFSLLPLNDGAVFCVQ